MDWLPARAGKSPALAGESPVNQDAADNNIENVHPAVNHQRKFSYSLPHAARRYRLAQLPAAG